MNYRLLLSKLCLFFIPVFVLGNTLTNTTVAFCGWDASWEDQYYPIIDQYSLVDSEFHAFLNCPDTPFCDTVDQVVPSLNIKEWYRYFNGAFTEQELRDIIYVRPLEWFIGEKGNEAYNNAIGKRLNAPEYSFFKAYLTLAKLTQNTVSDKSNGAGWYQGEGYDYEGAPAKTDKRVLLSKALELAAIAPDVFMKNRAGFQAVKMAHYLQENEAAIRYFSILLEKNNTHKYAYYRAMEEMAGAAYNRNFQLLAAKSYMEIYDQLPSRRQHVGTSLRLLNWDVIESNTEFSQAKKNKDVKSFFKAYHGRGSITREMENIARYDVNSSYLKVLAVRCLDQMQATIFAHSSVDYRDDYDYEDIEGFNARSLGNLSKEILSKDQIKDTDFWQLVCATSALFNQDYDKARSLLESNVTNKSYKKHYKRLKAAIKFMSITSIDRNLINESYQNIASDEDLRNHKPTVAAFFNHISALYNQEGNPITSVLSSIDYDSYTNDKPYDWTGVDLNHGYSWEYDSKYHYLNENHINNFDSFINLVNHTAFEKTILKRMKAPPQDYIHDLRGTYYLRDDLLDMALIEFNQVKQPKIFWEEEIRTEIFSAAIKDYMNVVFTSISNDYHKKYEHILGKNLVLKKNLITREQYTDNKIKLTETLIKLKKLAISEPEKATDYYYMIGNAWYNMSHKGWFVNNSFYVDNNSRNDLSSYSNHNEKYQAIDNNKMLTLANNYLLNGLNAPNGSRETKAAILFMLAKTNTCENAGENYGENSDSYFPEDCEEHIRYFSQLNEEYSDTQYHNEVLQECSWFSYYVY